MGPRTVILCISDDELTQLLQKNVFTAHGHRVLIAHDARSAESLVECGVDVVVGDGNTKLDWPLLAHRLKMRRPHISILLTGAATAPDADLVVLQPEISIFELLEQVCTLMMLQHATRWTMIPPEALGFWKYITR